MIGVKVGLNLDKTDWLTDTLVKAMQADGYIEVGIDKRIRLRRSIGGGTYPAWRVAGIVEFGNPNNRFMGRLAPIPPRPAITGMWYANRERYARSARTRAALIRQGRAAPDTMQRLAGMILKDIGLAYDFWDSEPEARDTPNSPLTLRLKRRRSTRQLINYGKLKRSWRARWVPTPPTLSMQKAIKNALKARRDAERTAKALMRAQVRSSMRPSWGRNPKIATTKMPKPKRVSKPSAGRVKGSGRASAPFGAKAAKRLGSAAVSAAPGVITNLFWLGSL